MGLLTPPKNYSELLPKLNGTTFLTTLVFLIALRAFNVIPYVELNDALVPSFEEHKEEVFEWVLSFGAIPLMGAVAAFFLSRLLEMHNKVAKFLRIRFLWDKYFIARPLMRRSGLQVPLNKSNVNRLMIEFYYPRVKNIDPHYAELFWNYAFGFWILFEHAIIVFLTALILPLASLVSLVGGVGPTFWVWIYFLLIVLVAAIQLIFVTGPRSTKQAEQLAAADVHKFFSEMKAGSSCGTPSLMG